MGKKGEPKTPGSGRKKGGGNKHTAALKDMILQALDNKGGVEYLEKQADANPVAFMTLVGKVLPLQLNGPGENGEIVITAITRRIVKHGA